MIPSVKSRPEKSLENDQKSLQEGATSSRVSHTSSRFDRFSTEDVAMKKLLLLSLSASIVFALNLIVPGNARAAGDMQGQLASLGISANFDTDPPGPALDRVLEGIEARLESLLSREEARDATLDATAPNSVQDAIVDTEITITETAITDIQTIISENQ
jgi:hypothetical protein